ncbi:hypothetical protein BPOR_0114g00030 [Botrytis porri]|uniref:Uncharacterized protein n=1 Tax=Botrytis porri TaxID=87229 RepID=A0A4Z1KXT0_9HELO|nr:hypothetical protein BPOR_0114g00030 [Botrytis porri]
MAERNAGNQLAPIDIHDSDSEDDVVEIITPGASLNIDTLSAGIRYRTDALLIQAAGEALGEPCSAYRERSSTRPSPCCIVLMGISKVSAEIAAGEIRGVVVETRIDMTEISYRFPTPTLLCHNALST